MQVTLSSGAQYEIAPLTVRQVDALMAGAASVETERQLVGASLANGGGYPDGFVLDMPYPDYKELVVKVLEVSGLAPGEGKASQ